MEVTGIIKVITAETQVSASFQKRELVIATEEQYPQYISINFVQQKTELLDRYGIGDLVKVSINLRGREWVNPQGETKYFNDIQGWKIEALNETSGKQPPSSEAKASTSNSSAPASNFTEEEHDDLPF